MIQNNIWQDKVAIVTGGSSGIGKATALELARNGARVLITGRDADRLAEVTNANPAIQALQADSADSGAAALMVKTALDLWGRLDMVVNNSGAGQPMPMAAYKSDIIANMAAINIIAPSELVNSAQDALAQTKGAIVNISTAVTQNAVPMLAHYAATKTALEHLTKSWAMELAPRGIRVNAIAPGPVKSGALTGMMGLPEEVAQQIEEQEASQIPLGRRGATTDIVPWILRLGGSDNEWLTGQTLTVDGGWALRV